MSILSPDFDPGLPVFEDWYKLEFWINDNFMKFQTSNLKRHENIRLALKRMCNHETLADPKTWMDPVMTHIRSFFSEGTTVDLIECSMWWNDANYTSFNITITTRIIREGIVVGRVRIAPK